MLTSTKRMWQPHQAAWQNIQLEVRECYAVIEPPFHNSGNNPSVHSLHTENIRDQLSFYCTDPRRQNNDIDDDSFWALCMGPCVMEV